MAVRDAALTTGMTGGIPLRWVCWTLFYKCEELCCESERGVPPSQALRGWDRVK